MSAAHSPMARDLHDVVHKQLDIDGALALQDKVEDKPEDLAHPSMDEFKIYEQMRRVLDQFYELKNQLDAAEELRLADYKELRKSANYDDEMKFTKLSDAIFTAGNAPRDGR